MIAILKTIHKRKGLEPSIHPFFPYKDCNMLMKWVTNSNVEFKKSSFMKSMMNGSKSWEKEVCNILFGIMKTWNLSKPWSLEIIAAECYWRKFCHSEQKNWHFLLNVWDSLIKVLTSSSIGWESRVMNDSWLHWMKLMVTSLKIHHKRKNIFYFLPFLSSWPLACKIIHPSTLYKKW